MQSLVNRCLETDGIDERRNLGRGKVFSSQTPQKQLGISKHHFAKKEAVGLRMVYINIIKPIYHRGMVCVGVCVCVCDVISPGGGQYRARNRW